MLNEEKRGIEEAYTSACTTSDLRVKADVRGDGDVIIAAGWSQSRIGAALLRLHTEFDGSEKPRMASASDFMARLPGTPKERKALASAMAHQHNMHETALHLGKLKALPAVREQVAIQLMKWGAENAVEKAASIVRWWLDQTCKSCSGTKWEVVQGSNRHGGKACRVCHGVGNSPIPHGQEGRKTANFMDQCIERARASIGRRLHSSMDRGI